MGILDSILETGGGRWIKFDTVGEAVTGTVVSITERQVTDYTTKLPATWADGNPKMELVIVLQTTEREDADDDGKRTMRVKGWGGPRAALHEACVKLGRPLEVGDDFYAKVTELHTSKGGTSKADVFVYSIRAGVPASAPVVDADMPF